MKNDFLLRKETRQKEERIMKTSFIALLCAVVGVIIMFTINLIMY